MSQDWKPCPFCGGTNIRRASSTADQDFRICGNCGAEAGNWNDRPIEDAFKNIAHNVSAILIELDKRITDLQKINCWISVTEKMPDNHEVVWAINPLMYQGLAFFDVETGYWYWNTSYASRTDITHWRYKPEPPA